MIKPSMPDGGNLVIERLEKRHDRTRFESGSEPLDTYLKKHVGQDQKRRLAFCYVLTFDDSSEVKGYYTLSATGVALDDLPDDLKRKIPYPLVPAVLLGRLARHLSLRGKDYGGYILVDALRRVARSEDFAAKIVVVEPKDQKAVAFYEKYGFRPLDDTASRMFIPFETIKTL